MQYFVRPPAAALAFLTSCLVAIAPGAHGSPVISAHSAVHPLSTTTKALDTAARSIYYQPPQAALGLTVVGESWSAYSRGVNRINACSTVGAESWLATDAGVKEVDRARRAVTHFTRLDGLPDERVVAIAAAPEAAWAIVATRRNEAFAAEFCEFTRTTKRWRVLRAASRPIVPSVPDSFGSHRQYGPGDPLENALVAACPEKVCYALSPIRRDDRTLVQCYDRRLNTWDEILCPPEFMSDRTSLSVAWIDVDRDGVWMATTAGLLRYRHRERQWHRYLPDRMVYGVTRADDASLWLITYSGVQAPHVDGSPAGLDASPGGDHWYVTHFTPKSGAAVDYLAPESSNRQLAYGGRLPIVFSGISLVDHNIWLTPGVRTVNSVVAPFYRMDLSGAHWRSYSPQAPQEIDAVPDAALAQPTLPRTTLQAVYYPWRLGEWICRDVPEPVTAPVAANPQVGRDRDGTIWSTDGRSILQSDEHGVTLRRFGLSRAPLTMTPQVSAVAVLNGTLYAMSTGDVQAYDLHALHAATWRPQRLPRNSYLNPNDERLISAGVRLWIGTPTTALLYDPGTKLFDAVFSTQNGGYRLLGTIDGSALLRGPDNLLYRPDAATGEPEAVDLAPLSPEITMRYERPIPFGVSSSAVWFRMQDRRDPEKWLYLSYLPATQRWTIGHLANRPNPSPPTCLSIGSLTYIPVSEEDAAVRCFDAATEAWTSVAPKAPAGHGLQMMTVVDVDGDGVWVLDGGMRSLMCYQRSTKSWTVYDIPPGLSLIQNGNESVRFQENVYVATSQGVWAFHTGTHSWSQLPGFMTRDVYLNGLAVDASGVWSIARPGNGNQALAVRLDKASHQWTVWGEKEGFPETAYPPNILPDGVGAWAVAAGVCYHWSHDLNRWENVSAQLGREEKPAAIESAAALRDLDRTAWVQIAAIELDGDSVWLLPRYGARIGAVQATRSLLVRFDRRSGRIERLSPSTDLGAEVTGNLMQVERDAVWVPTSSGVYRYGKESRSWTKVAPPIAASAWVSTDTMKVIHQDRTYWFIGQDSAIRWSE